jgi:hypothetical protein
MYMVTESGTVYICIFISKYKIELAAYQLIVSSNYHTLDETNEYC